MNGSVTESLWVNKTHKNKPVRYILDKIGQHVTVIDFKIFKPTAPTNPNEYDVPKICQTTPLPTAKHYMNFSRDFDDND